MRPVLSICIPTKNRISLLKETVASVLSQGLDSSVEVLISDNLSTDGTREYLSNLSHPCIRNIFRESDGGFSANVNSLINELNGQFFLLLHDDDMLVAGALNNLIEQLKRESEANLVVGSCYYLFESSLKQKILFAQTDEKCDPNAAIQRLLVKWSLRAPAIVYRSNVINRENFYQDRFGIAKDSALIFDYLVSGKTLFTSLPIGIYRVGEHSETSEKIYTKSWGKDTLALCSYAKDLIKSFNGEAPYRPYVTFYAGWLQAFGISQIKRRLLLYGILNLMSGIITRISGGLVAFKPLSRLYV